MAEAPAFSLGPALANDGIIDYSTSEGIKIYSAATSSLVEDPLFDCEAGGLSHFLGKIGIRAHANGWDRSIFAIPRDLADPLGEAYSFLSQYGIVSLAQTQAHAATYVSTNSRAAQDSIQLGIAIMKSVSVSGFNRLTIRKTEYTIQGHVAGVVLLKILVGVSHIDTNATTSYIRNELCSLELYLPQIGYDVEKLNEHVRHLMENLEARGETTYDLLSFLFKAYAVVPDAKFRAYIETKKSEYEEGRMAMDGSPFTSEYLMLLGDNKCKGMKQNKTWIAPSAEDEKIVALQAEVSKLQQAVQGGSKQAVTRKADNKSPKSKERPAKPAWMLEEPTNGSPLILNSKGKMYWWCPKHHSFGRHQPQDCEGKGIKMPPSGPEGARESRLANAVSALVEDEDEFADDS
jgi:hypothetical protein